MQSQAVELVADIIDRIENRHPGPGRPPVPTLEVIRTLGFFLREGVQWRELKATDGRASGSTLRRRLDEWHTTAVLRRVHAVLVRMARSGPRRRHMGCRGGQLFGAGQAGRRADRPEPDRPRQARDQVPRGRLDRRSAAGGHPFTRQRA
ncbi:transposase [Azospirillum sp. CT11-132]|uniref:transposase n=1 Tax=Azospirillum sp. CT11-132 TaxID=3396317 RepID=UPI0039A56BF1